MPVSAPSRTATQGAASRRSRARLKSNTAPASQTRQRCSGTGGASAGVRQVTRASRGSAGRGGVSADQQDVRHAEPHQLAQQRRRRRTVRPDDGLAHRGLHPR